MIRPGTRANSLNLFSCKSIYTIPQIECVLISMSMGYVDKLTGTNITCMEEICRNKKIEFISKCARGNATSKQRNAAMTNYLCPS